MKFLIILTIFIFNFKAQAQIQRSPKAKYTSPVFLSNEPKWHYTVFDSSNIGFPIEKLPADHITDGYNAITYIRPWSWQPTFEGDFMYTYSTSFGTTSTIFGAIVQKININTGKVLWTQVFDNRHSNRQEYVQSIEVKRDTLELVTMRRIGSHINDLPFSYNTFGANSFACLRKYSKNTGELLTYKCWDTLNPSISIIAPHSEGNRIFKKNDDGSFTYLNSKILSKKNIEFKIIDANGNLVFERIDTMYYPKEKYELSNLNLTSPGGKMMFLNNDTILVGYNYDINLGSGRQFQKDLCYIQIYNNKLNPIGQINTGIFVEMFNDINNISIRSADEKLMLLYINRTNSTNFVLCDYNLNIISNVEYKQSPNKFIVGYSYLKHSKKPFMITRTYGPQIPNEIPQTLEYSIFENNEWKFKFSQELGDDHYIDEIKYLSETKNNDVIMCVDHAYYNEDIDLSCYETDMWMLIDGSKLGLKTSTIDESVSKLKIYPNPINDILHIESEKFISNVEILDISGKILLSETLNSNQGQINFANISNGIYFMNIRNKENQVVKIEKVVKIE